MNARKRRRSPPRSQASSASTPPDHIVAHTNGEIRRQSENTYIGRPVGGQPTINDEADNVRYLQPDDLNAYYIHPSMRQQIGDYPGRHLPLPRLTRQGPHEVQSPGHDSGVIRRAGAPARVSPVNAWTRWGPWLSEPLDLRPNPLAIPVTQAVAADQVENLAHARRNSCHDIAHHNPQKTKRSADYVGRPSRKYEPKQLDREGGR